MTSIAASYCRIPTRGQNCDTRGVTATAHDQPMNTNAASPSPDFDPVLDVVGDRITVHLELTDAGLARFVEGVPAEDRPGLAANALRVGLHALATAGTGAHLDVIRSEFGRMVEQMTATNTRAAEALYASLRANFADGEGRVPARSKPSWATPDGSSASRRTCSSQSARQRGGAAERGPGPRFDGDGSRLALLLDPTREASPLHQFRTEVTGEFRSLSERLASLEAANGAQRTSAREGRPRASSSRTRSRPAPGPARARDGRLPGADRHPGRRRTAIQEGRLRPDRGSQPDRRTGAAGRDRGPGLLAQPPRAGRGADLCGTGQPGERPSRW